jgi:peroxiredoxin
VIEVGQRAPEFDLADQDDNRVGLRDFAGRTVSANSLQNRRI